MSTFHYLFVSCKAFVRNLLNFSDMEKREKNRSLERFCNVKHD